jgi:hypothetical protein
MCCAVAEPWQAAQWADGHARQCPLCGTWVQATIAGTVADGMNAHRKTVHGGSAVQGD